MSETRHKLVPPATPPHLIRERFDLECVRRRLTTDTQRAAALGVSQAQLSKILTGQSHPGRRFIHAAMTLFDDCDYRDLFTSNDHQEGDHR